MNRLKYLFLSCLTVIMGGCTDHNDQSIKVTVNNESSVDRTMETVEIVWADIEDKSEGITPENVIVTNSQGDELTSQIIFHGNNEPQFLIFQADANARSKSEYKIMAGQRTGYKQQAYGRFVPERKDDYAWENNIVAFRIYGPALEEELVTNGIDYWSKSTSNLIIDKWYKEDDYHTDSGEGNDCYKVGRTLGSGASVPYVDDTLRFSRNFESWETLDNGPLRTTVKLTYAPFPAGTDTVSFVKYISLDANTRFNKMTDVYSGDFTSLPIAAGIALHDGCRIFSGPDYIAVAEPASDSHTGNDGDIFIAVLMEGGFKKGNNSENIVAVKNTIPGEPFVYYMGAATTKEFVINSDDDWEKAVQRQSEIIKNPLKISIK